MTGKPIHIGDVALCRPVLRGRDVSMIEADHGPTHGRLASIRHGLQPARPIADPSASLSEDSGHARFREPAIGGQPWASSSTGSTWTTASDTRGSSRRILADTA